MNCFNRIMLAIGLFAVSQIAYSDSITDTYTTGDTLTATTLNNIKSAVNDNDARINAAGPYVDTRAPTSADDVNDANAYSVGSIWVDSLRGGTYILINNTAGSALWSQMSPQRYFLIGDSGPAGGIIFYVTDGGLHGLEAAPTDTSPTQAPWGCDATTTGATGLVIGTGASNTTAIVAAPCLMVGDAAALADAYTLNGFTDWFLPSQNELNELYLNRVVVGGFFPASAYYWSSSEISVTNAWTQNFPNGDLLSVAKSNSPYVRAVRAF